LPASGRLPFSAEPADDRRTNLGPPIDRYGFWRSAGMTH